MVEPGLWGRCGVGQLWDSPTRGGGRTCCTPGGCVVTSQMPPGEQGLGPFDVQFSTQYRLRCALECSPCGSRVNRLSQAITPSSWNLFLGTVGGQTKPLGQQGKVGGRGNHRLRLSPGGLMS